MVDEPRGYSGRMQQCFTVFTDIYKVFLLLCHCCIQLEIKLTTTTKLVMAKWMVARCNCCQIRRNLRPPWYTCTQAHIRHYSDITWPAWWLKSPETSCLFRLISNFAFNHLITSWHRKPLWALLILGGGTVSVTRALRVSFEDNTLYCITSMLRSKNFKTSQQLLFWILSVKLRVIRHVV